MIPELNIVSITLEDFRETTDISEDEIALLESNSVARSDMADHLLTALGWTEAVEVALDVWREEQARAKAREKVLGGREP